MSGVNILAVPLQQGLEAGMVADDVGELIEAEHPTSLPCVSTGSNSRTEPGLVSGCQISRSVGIPVPEGGEFRPIPDLVSQAENGSGLTLPKPGGRLRRA
jgi:hypothetical protein